VHLDPALQYDVVVLVTFPQSRHLGFDVQRELLLGPRRPPAPRFLLVTHNPDKLVDGCTAALTPGMQQLLLQQAVVWEPPADADAGAGAAGEAAGAAEPGAEGTVAAAAAAAVEVAAGGQQQLPPRVQLLALAPRVAEYTSALLEAWAAGRHSVAGQPSAEVPWVAPLTPWEPPGAAAAAGHSSSLSGGSLSGGSLGAEHGQQEPAQHLCIQVGVGWSGCLCGRMLWRD